MMSYGYACALVAIAFCLLGIVFGYVIVEVMTEAIGDTIQILSIPLDADR